VGRLVDRGKRPDAVAARLGSFRRAAERRQSDVSQARHITLACPRGSNDPLRDNFLHNGGLAGVVKLFASGVESFAHDAGDVIESLIADARTEESKPRDSPLTPRCPALVVYDLRAIRR
jgi:hypothetical protein